MDHLYPVAAIEPVLTLTSLSLSLIYLRTCLRQIIFIIKFPWRNQFVNCKGGQIHCPGTADRISSLHLLFSTDQIIFIFGNWFGTQPYQVGPHFLLQFSGRQVVRIVYLCLKLSKLFSSSNFLINLIIIVFVLVGVTILAMLALHIIDLTISVKPEHHINIKKNIVYKFSQANILSK